jgi:hypothetical protein
MNIDCHCNTADRYMAFNIYPPYQKDIPHILYTSDTFRFISLFYFSVYLSVLSLCFTIALSRSSLARDLHGFQGCEAF